jgi:hypothetical protein
MACMFCKETCYLGLIPYSDFVPNTVKKLDAKDEV